MSVANAKFLPGEAPELSTLQRTGSGSAAVVSMHFAYAHASHLFAYASVLQNLGFAVTLILDEKYRSFVSQSPIEGTRCIFAGRGLPAPPSCDIAVICNSSSRNHRLARKLRGQGTKVIYVFHEPEPIWSLAVLRSEGWKKTIRFLLSAYFSILTVRASSCVIVCSSFGRALYWASYRYFNENVNVVPLLFNDEIGEAKFRQMRSGKGAFGFVGTACKSHGFLDFVAFAKFSIRSGSDIPFIIATRTDITSTLLADPEFADLVQVKRIRLQHGRDLSNDEINDCYLECFCVWNLYLRSTQSGVLPRAFMAGTAVLASKIGSFPEYVIPGLTGELIDLGASSAEILDLVNNIRERNASYIQACRDSFLTTFSSEANVATVGKLLEHISNAPVLP